MSFLYYSLLLLFLVLSFFLILLVLIQKGRGGGLSAAFGGVGGNTAFGAKTGDVLTWATSIVFGVFLLLAIGMNLIANNVHEERTKLDAGAPTTAPTDTSAAVSSAIIDKLPLPATTTPSTTAPSTTPPAVIAPAATLPTTVPAN